MKWIKRAVLGIFLAAAAVIGVLGFTKYQARQAEAKAAEETSRKKEQIKEIYTTEYQEAVKKRLETAKESGTYTTEKMLVEQIRCLFMSILQQKNRFLSPMLFLCPIAKLQILEEKSIRKRLIPQNMNFRSQVSFRIWKIRSPLRWKQKAEL